MQNKSHTFKFLSDVQIGLKHLKLNRFMKLTNHTVGTYAQYIGDIVHPTLRRNPRETDEACHRK